MATVEFLNPLEELGVGTINLDSLVWRTARSILDLPDTGGLFRIRWNTNESHTFLKRRGIINVSYGYRGRIADELLVTSYPDDILYIGKSQSIRQRFNTIISDDPNSNAVARKIFALLIDDSSTAPRHQRDDITAQELEEILAEIVCDYMEIPHPVEREFRRSYEIGIAKPCLNIEFEH